MGPLALVLLLFAAPPAPPAAEPAQGALHVSFVYMPPTSVEPTYHTAMWLETEAGALVKTLFVTNDLSATEYKVGEACPDWVKQANWEKAAKPEVDAVTGPTPNVGTGGRSFDLAKLGITPGRYVFKLQVHITDTYNILYRGTLIVGDTPSEVVLETLYAPGKPPGGTEFVQNVRARYVPAAAR